MFTRLALMGLAVFALANTTSATMAQELQLGSNENAIAQVVAARLLTDIYTKAGLTVQITPLPGARANALAMAGGKDGEVARIPAYFVKNPSLVKVEPAYYYLTTGVFARADKGIAVSSKEDLQKYKVGIVRGIAHAEAITQGLVDLQVVNTYEQLYLMLNAGRIDVAIDEGINGPATLKALGLKGINQVGEIARLDLFAVLTPARKDLAPKISTAIKAMKASGELGKLTKRYEDEAVKK